MKAINLITVFSHHHRRFELAVGRPIRLWRRRRSVWSWLATRTYRLRLGRRLGAMAARPPVAHPGAAKSMPRKGA